MPYNGAMNRARVCVPVCVGRASEMRRAIESAAGLGGLVELRFDCLEPGELENALGELEALLASPRCPFIITFRPAAQGGRREVTGAERAAFWSRITSLLERRGAEVSDGHYVDLEFEDGLAAERLNEFAGLATVICSHHAPAGEPLDLGDLYERMSATGAGVLKIAVTAHDAADCIDVFRLLARARREGLSIIALAMGEAGVLTRLLGPSRGSFLTFASLEAGRETASGQITAEEMRGLYRVQSIDEDTLITGVVGSPVSHSLSPHIHNAAFNALGQNAVYLPIEVARLDEFMRRMVSPRTREFEWRLRGLSVTAPHKSAVIGHLDWVEPKASEIGAVNTLVVEGERLRGYNTDADAALTALRGLIELRGARVAVVGAGGAARAVLWGLRREGAHATVFARDVDRARPTAVRFGASVTSSDGARFGDYDVVINATPLGTRGREEGETPATARQLRGARVAYDLVYNPSTTRFMREASEAGCTTVGGLSMLVAQAASQFELWTGLDAPVDAMREAAEKRLSDAGC